MHKEQEHAALVNRCSTLETEAFLNLWHTHITCSGTCSRLQPAFVPAHVRCLCAVAVAAYISIFSCRKGIGCVGEESEDYPCDILGGCRKRCLICTSS